MFKKISLIGALVGCLGAAYSAADVPALMVEEESRRSYPAPCGKENYIEEISAFDESSQPTAAFEMWEGREVLGKLLQMTTASVEFRQYMEEHYPQLTEVLGIFDRKESLSFWSIVAQTEEDLAPLAKSLPAHALVRFESEGFIDPNQTIRTVEGLFRAPEILNALMIDLSGTFLGGDIANILRPTYRSMITCLSLDYCNLGEPESRTANLSHLEAILGEDSNLVYLGLSGNNLEDEGAKVIGRALLTNDTLLMLTLGDNQITAEGAHFLGLGLQSNETLQFLNLSCNPLKDGAWDLVWKCRENEALRDLYLVHVGLSTGSKQTIAEMADSFVVSKTITFREPLINIPRVEGLPQDAEEEILRRRRMLSSSVAY